MPRELRPSGAGPLSFDVHPNSSDSTVVAPRHVITPVKNSRRRERHLFVSSINNAKLTLMQVRSALRNVTKPSQVLVFVRRGPVRSESRSLGAWAPA